MMKSFIFRQEYGDGELLVPPPRPPYPSAENLTQLQHQHPHQHPHLHNGHDEFTSSYVVSVRACLYACPSHPDIENPVSKTPTPPSFSSKGPFPLSDCDCESDVVNNINNKYK